MVHSEYVLDAAECVVLGKFTRFLHPTGSATFGRRATATTAEQSVAVGNGTLALRVLGISPSSIRRHIGGNY